MQIVQRLIQTLASPPNIVGMQILTRLLCTPSNVLPSIFSPFVFIKDLSPYPPQKFLSAVGYWHTNLALGDRHCLVSSNEWKRKIIRCCCVHSPLEWQSPFEVWRLTQPILVAQGKTQSLISFSQYSKAIRFQDFEYLG
jgi:hypothetical protein